MPWRLGSFASSMDAAFEEMLAWPAQSRIPIRIRPDAGVRLEQDPFFADIDKQREEERTSENEGSPYASVKVYSHSSVTRNGETTSKISRKFEDESGRRIERTERKIGGKSLIETSRRENLESEPAFERRVVLNEHEVGPHDHEETDQDALMEDFDAEWDRGFFGREGSSTLHDADNTPITRESVKSTPEEIPSVDTAHESPVQMPQDEMQAQQGLEDGNVWNSRIAHLASMHQQGLLTDEEFLAAKHADL